MILCTINTASAYSYDGIGDYSYYDGQISIDMSQLFKMSPDNFSIEFYFKVNTNNTDMILYEYGTQRLKISDFNMSIIPNQTYYGKFEVEDGKRIVECNVYKQHTLSIGNRSKLYYDGCIDDLKVYDNENKYNFIHDKLIEMFGLKIQLPPEVENVNWTYTRALTQEEITELYLNWLNTTKIDN